MNQRKTVESRREDGEGHILYENLEENKGLKEGSGRERLNC